MLPLFLQLGVDVMPPILLLLALPLTLLLGHMRPFFCSCVGVMLPILLLLVLPLTLLLG